MRIDNIKSNFSAAKELSVIIINFNTPESTSECISSLNKHLLCNYEIIVVDNNSDDESRHFITNLHPEVCWIQLNKNMGYGSAVNKGFIKSIGEYILILNSDIIILSNFFDYLKEKYIEFNAGVIGIQLILPGKEVQNTVSNFPEFMTIMGEDIRWIGKIKKFSRYSMNLNPRVNLNKVDWLTGAFMFISRQNFIQIGGFDEQFFMYYEDIDLCKKLSANGFSNYYLTEHSAIHKHCYSVNKQKKKYNFYKIINRRSAIYYVEKHLNKQIHLYKSLLFITYIVKTIKELFFLLILFWYLRKRRKIIYYLKTNLKILRMLMYKGT